MKETGLKLVKVSKEKVLEKLKLNKVKHQQDYDVALLGWKTEIRENLERELQKVQDGNYDKLDFGFTFSCKKPENHIKEYEVIIGMLEMDENLSTILTDIDYRQYILNEWDWMQNWQLSNMKYISKMSGQ